MNKVKSKFVIHFVAVLLFFLTFFYPSNADALTVKQVPNPRQINGGWVTDMVSILDNKTETEINKIITELEAKNGTEIAVVTVPETKPSKTSKQFTTQLFNYWRIGKKGENNGILFLISVGDRRIEIETGYGIESILPNDQIQDIIDNKITPKFKQGDYNQGILEGTKSLILELEQQSSNNLKKTEIYEIISRKNINFLIISFTVIGFYLLLFMIVEKYKGKIKKYYRLTFGTHDNIQSFGGSFDSDTGGSFGGGSSGGDGGGGSW